MNGQGKSGDFARELLIYNADIVTEQGVVERGAALISGGIITQIGDANEAELMKRVQVEAMLREVALHGDLVQPLGAPELVDAHGSWLLPGFVDIHVHGGHGHDFMDASIKSLDAITRFHSAHGTTAMLATTVTASREAISSVFAAVGQYLAAAMPYAQLLGIHLEGPFISPRYPGAQNPQFIVPPQLGWVTAWHDEYPGLLRMLTLAPETVGALELVRWLSGQGIVAACGHTDASYAEMGRAAEAGLTHAVHAFNAMKPLHHREPGTVGAVLTDARISAEVIADGHHVHEAGIRLLCRTKTERNLVLITDAIAAAGLGDGLFQLGGLDVVVQDGVARLREGDSLAGSTLTMIDAFRFVVRNVGLSVRQASELASGNPARVLGLDHRIGDIAVGKQADLLLVNSNLDIERTWIKGNERSRC